MNSTTLWEPPPKRVAVFRALQLGDMLCAVPALRALRAFLPRARITLIGLAWAQDFVKRFHRHVDDFLPFPGFPGFPEQEASAEDLLRFFVHARRREFDVALQLHGSGEFSNVLVALIGAKRVAGFRRDNDRRFDPSRHLVWRDDLPEVLIPLRLIEALGIPPRGTELEMPLSTKDLAQWRRLADRCRLQPYRYVCVHPGARMPSRRWPLERFAAVGRSLADDWRVVITGGASEIGMARDLAQDIGANAVSVAGETSLGSLAVLIAKSKLLICNDTGVSHVAAAMRAARSRAPPRPCVRRSLPAVRALRVSDRAPVRARRQRRRRRERSAHDARQGASTCRISVCEF